MGVKLAKQSRRATPPAVMPPRPASFQNSTSRPDCVRIFRTRDSSWFTGPVQSWRTIAVMVGDVHRLSLEPFLLCP